MKRLFLGYRIMIAIAVLLACGAVLLAVLLFTAVSDQQDALKEQQANVCKIQGTVFAVGLANLGLALQEANYLSTHVHNNEIRAYYKAVAPALRQTLDATFKHPPKCGQKFEFTIQIEGEKPRHVVTPGP